MNHRFFTRAAAKSKRQASFPLSLSRGESSVAEEEDLSSSPLILSQKILFQNRPDSSDSQTTAKG